jgi:Sulfotransferase family
MTSSAERRFPDFFIVGHPKSGTTALYEMLRSHPQIFMPDLKEPRWFATDLRERFGGDGRLPKSEDQYLDLFVRAAAGQVTGEASPSYLRSKLAAGLIAEARPDARIIAILREPAGFLRSLHMELVQNHVEPEQDLRAALAGEQIGPDGLRRYTDRIAYVEQLRRYREVFAPEQVLVLIYDDFRRDNEGTVRTVLRFLGVDDSFALRSVEANPSVQVRSLRLDRLTRRAQGAQGPMARALKDRIKTLSRGGAVFARARRRLVYTAPQPAEEALMRELRERFKPEVHALGEYLDRDLLALWGYERDR